MTEKILLTDDVNFEKTWLDFRKQHGIHRVVAILGGALFDVHGLPDDLLRESQTILERRLWPCIKRFLGPLRNHGLTIVTSGTNRGVPRIAAELSSAMGFPLVYVHPERAHKYLNIQTKAHLEICLPPRIGDSEWGDDSADLIKLSDALLILGGSTGTLTEIAHAFKVNESRIRNDSRLIFMVAIHGFGGAGDQLHTLCYSPELRSKCMPPRLVYEGQEKEAAKITLRAIGADEIYIDD